VTYEDGSVLTAGDVVTKRWKVKNNSSSPWPDGTFLQFIGGLILPNQPIKQSVPKAKSGETVEISVDVRMPSEFGRFRGYYRLAKPSTPSSPPVTFGHNLWIEASVEPKSNISPLPSSSSSSSSSSFSSPKPVTNTKPLDIPKPVQQQQQQLQQLQQLPPQHPQQQPLPQQQQQEQKQEKQEQKQEQPQPQQQQQQQQPFVKSSEAPKIEIKSVKSEVVSVSVSETPKIENKEEPYTGPYAAELADIRKMGFQEPTELIIRLLSSMQNRRNRISPIDFVVHKLVEKRY